MAPRIVSVFRITGASTKRLRGPFECEPSLPALLSQTAYASILKTFQALLGRKMDALEKVDDGRLVLETPPDPRTGATSIELDPLEWIHLITSHIPDPGRHCQRFYGAYSNRGQISLAAPDDETAGLPAAKLPERDNSDVSREARSTWARLIKKIFEADPLVCSCGGRMRIVSFITDPRVVDRILRHRESERCKTQDPFETRAPPDVASAMVQ